MTIRRLFVYFQVETIHGFGLDRFPGAASRFCAGTPHEFVSLDREFVSLDAETERGIGRESIPGGESP